MDRHRLEQIEQYVLGFFQAQRRTRILAHELFNTSEFANADLVRALEALEKQERLLVRHTSEGNDYVSLTPQGADRLGLEPGHFDDSSVMPHPPKSATRT